MNEQQIAQLQQQAQQQAQQLVMLKARLFDTEEQAQQQAQQMEAIQQWIGQVAQAFGVEATEQGFDISALSEILSEAAQDYAAKHPQQEQGVEEVEMLPPDAE